MFLNSFKRKTLAASVLMASVGLSACGGGGGTTVQIATNVIVSDALIVNALVTDANGATATPIGNGVYQFADTPRAPVKVRTKNTDSSGVVTYQEMNGTQGYQANEDIPWNVGLNVNYVPSGAVDIQANPVTALIPSSWDGSSAVGGMSADFLNNALLQDASVNQTVARSGVDGISSTTRTAVQTMAAAITTVQESLVKMGLSADQTATLLDNISKDSFSDDGIKSVDTENNSTEAADFSNDVEQALIGVATDEQKTTIKLIANALEDDKDLLEREPNSAEQVISAYVDAIDVSTPTEPKFDQEAASSSLLTSVENVLGDIVDDLYLVAGFVTTNSVKPIEFDVNTTFMQGVSFEYIDKTESSEAKIIISRTDEEPIEHLYKPKTETTPYSVYDWTDTGETLNSSIFLSYVDEYPVNDTGSFENITGRIWFYGDTENPFRAVVATSEEICNLVSKVDSEEPTLDLTSLNENWKSTSDFLETINSMNAAKDGVPLSCE